MKRSRFLGIVAGVPARDEEQTSMTTSLIVRPAVQKQIDDKKRREEYDRMEFTHPQWHSSEAKASWLGDNETKRNRLSRGGIMLPLKNSDWFAIGYDAAMAKLDSDGLGDD